MTRSCWGLRTVIVLSLFCFDRVSADDVSAVFSRALAYLQKEARTTELRELRVQALDEYSDRWGVIQVLLDLAVRNQSRSELIEVIQSGWRNNRCAGSNPNKDMCGRLKAIWDRNLDSLLLLESSAGQLEKARRFLQSADCSQGIEVLTALRVQEGDQRDLLELLEKAYSCVGNESSLTQVQGALKDLKLETLSR